MALVNPNIAMSFRQPDIQAPNALAQYAQIQQIQNAQNQNALAQYQLGAAQRADEQQSNLYAAVRKPDFKLDFQTAIQYGAPGLAAFKAQQEAAGTALTQAKTQGEIDAQQATAAKGRLDAFSTALAPLVSAVQAKKPITHQDVFAQANRLVSQGLLRKEDLSSIPMNMAELPSFVMNMASSTENSRKALETYLPKALVAGGDVINVNPLAEGGIGKPLSRVSMTDYQKLQNQIAQEQLGVSKGQLGVAQLNANISAARLQFDKAKAEQPQFNAQAGGFIAPPTKENPEGVFIPAKGIQAAKDQSAAVKALQSAGYNVETGEDNISKLIAKSTSGGLQAGGAAALAFLGKSTEGRKAIAALEGTANQIATDLAGGKLGAGISNTDREFIVSALGDVANPNKTSEERLAGWNAAKQRMMLTGLIPPPKTTPAAAGAPAAAANIVVTPDGQSLTFPNAAAAAQFKKAAGL
jgi:hypothetical protein